MSDSVNGRSQAALRVFLAVSCLAVALFIGLFAWQKSVQSGHEDDAQRHLEVASMIQEAEADGVAAGEILQQYVQTGDETLLPQMQARTDAGVRKLTAALDLAGSDPNNFVQQGSQIVQAAGQIVAIRQSGDVQGAAAALTELSNGFQAFIGAQDEFVQDQRALADQSTQKAEDAQALAAWFAIAAAVVGFTLVGGASVVLIRRLARRATAEALPG